CPSFSRDCPSFAGREGLSLFRRPAGQDMVPRGASRGPRCVRRRAARHDGDLMTDAATLELNQMLALQLAEYWHEIDFNGGREASAYYTDNAVFHGQFASYEGVTKIQQFYDWRRTRGAR